MISTAAENASSSAPFLSLLVLSSDDYMKFFGTAQNATFDILCMVIHNCRARCSGDL